MMNEVIKNGKISGTVKAPVSKSSLHRLLICAAFSDKKTKIKGVHGPISDDVSATAGCLEALGAKIERVGDTFSVTPAANSPKEATLNVRESGSTLRFFVPIAAALGVSADLVMGGRLPERPMGPLSEVLAAHGARTRKSENVFHVEGKIAGGEYRVRADVSSQFISGILFALPLCGGGTITLVGRPESSGYLDMTLDAFRTFGVRCERDGDVITVPSGGYRSPGSVTAEGDWSGAAFMLCAGAVGGPVTVTGLDPSSRQGDRRIAQILREMGASVTEDGNGITVSRGDLHGVTLDAADVPDLVPPVTALAAAADGVTEIVGAARLRMKESDRLAALTELFTALGADVRETVDGLYVHGNGRLRGGVADSVGDHRIAMAAAVASAAADGDVTVLGAGCVSKSYPSFWDDFEALGGKTDRE